MTVVKAVFTIGKSWNSIERMIASSGSGLNPSEIEPDSRGSSFYGEEEAVNAQDGNRALE